MTKAELILKVALATGRPSAHVERVLNAITDQISRSLAEGDQLVLRGFGTFEVKERAARTARNPRTNEAVPMAATRVAKFRPAKTLKELVAGDE